ncbi:sugar phosphate nucleotidyltransferase [Flavobacteriaceae bacterium]|nr:sugar phosphate nucleotidyltransferase [Flavobacteriaceae bacterium]
MDKKLIIMAGGASSRMKRSLETSELTPETKKIASSAHKSLIPLGSKQKPLLFHLIQNAVNAGFKEVYLITSPENEAFRECVGSASKNNLFAGALVHYAIQYLPQGRNKPLGTADAVQQAMEQHPELKNEFFSICNADNLYSVHAFALLLAPRDTPHALISYNRSSLNYSSARMSSFAIIDISEEGLLENIIEKPDPETFKNYEDTSDHIGVSMNIFSFEGALLFPYLKNCPIHLERNEKELPEAVRIMISEPKNKIRCFKVSEHILDLTSAEDLKNFSDL